jgi:hypothetical protein
LLQPIANAPVPANWGTSAVSFWDVVMGQVDRCAPRGLDVRPD